MCNCDLDFGDGCSLVRFIVVDSDCAVCLAK